MALGLTGVSKQDWHLHNDTKAKKSVTKSQGDIANWMAINIYFL